MQHVRICISTLTVKQHYLADVIAGIILAEGSNVAAAKIDSVFAKKMLHSSIDSPKDK